MKSKYCVNIFTTGCSQYFLTTSEQLSKIHVAMEIPTKKSYRKTIKSFNRSLGRPHDTPVVEDTCLTGYCMLRVIVYDYRVFENEERRVRKNEKQTFEGENALRGLIFPRHQRVVILF